METLTWVLLTNAIAWVGLGGYVAFLGLQQRGLARRQAQWETLRND